MKIIRRASIEWQGGSQTGGGQITTQSHALDKHAYGFGSRFQEQKGTNPEELIAAAHGACFTMYFSYLLDAEKFVAEQIETKVALTLEYGVTESFDITTIRLSLAAKVPGLDQENFTRIVNMAKAGCAVSKVLKADISLEATLLP